MSLLKEAQILFFLNLRPILYSYHNLIMSYLVRFNPFLKNAHSTACDRDATTINIASETDMLERRPPAGVVTGSEVFRRHRAVFPGAVPE